MASASPLTRANLALHNASSFSFPRVGQEDGWLDLRHEPATRSDLSSEQSRSCAGEEMNLDDVEGIRAACASVGLPRYTGEDHVLGHNHHGNVALVERSDGCMVLRGVSGTHVYHEDFQAFLDHLCAACKGAKPIFY